MRLAVVGGGLQGTEAAYLAAKAGWEVRLVDRRPKVPASGLAGSFVQADANDEQGLDRALADADLVLPALEDTQALETLTRWAGLQGVPLAFDLVAYSVSCSKQASNRLFERRGFAVPQAWPGCAFPVLAKPDGLSGSRGVRVFATEKALRAWLDGSEGPVDPASWVIQEFLTGPSFSMEVLGLPGAHRALQATDLAMDAGYDCKRVEAPSLLAAEPAAELARTAVVLAEALQLRGLMDLEVILHDGEFRLLEIDARLPSQTPIAVFWSTGYNMVRALGELFLPGGGGRAEELSPADRWRSVVLEHVHAYANRLEVAGEHVMIRRSPLSVRRDFFGVDEAITDYAPGRTDWVATLIVTGADRAETKRRHDETVAAIRRTCGLSDYRDPEPTP
jgi:pyrrolysine biosynthesis protein PylC